MTPEEIKKENANIAKEYKELLSISYRRLTASDKKLIRKAFDVVWRKGLLWKLHSRGILGSLWHVVAAFLGPSSAFVR